MLIARWQHRGAAVAARFAASLQRETRLELVETQRQLAEARAAIARAEGEADDLRTAGDRQNKSSSQSHGALSRERDALRADVSRLEQGLSAARAEVKCGEATASMLLQQLELARSTLGGQRDLAQQRADDAIATREEERLGREKAEEEAAAVANAACVIRREEGERTQEALYTSARPPRACCASWRPCDPRQVRRGDVPTP